MIHVGLERSEASAGLGRSLASNDMPGSRIGTGYGRVNYLAISSSVIMTGASCGLSTQYNHLVSAALARHIDDALIGHVDPEEEIDLDIQAMWADVDRMERER